MIFRVFILLFLSFAAQAGEIVASLKAQTNPLALRFNPFDPSRLVVMSQVGEVTFWNLQTKEAYVRFFWTPEFDLPEIEIPGIAFSSDRKFVFLKDASRIEMRRLDDGTLVRSFKTSEEGIYYGFALSRDNLFVASLLDGNRVCVWSVASGAVIGDWKLPPANHLTHVLGMTHAFSFSQDGKKLALFDASMIRFVNLTDGSVKDVEFEMPDRLPDQGWSIVSVDVSKDFRFATAIAWSPLATPKVQLFVFNLETGKKVVEANPENAVVARFSSDGRSLIVFDLNDHMYNFSIVEGRLSERTVLSGLNHNMSWQFDGMFDEVSDFTSDSKFFAVKQKNQHDQFEVKVWNTD